MTQHPYNVEDLTVLVVDDHPPMRKTLKALLAKMGFSRILEASNGDQAIEMLGEQVVSLILLDLYMKRNGFEVIEFVRSSDIGSDTPIIVVTGEASKEDIVKASDLGADDYVIKPFHTPDVEKKIHTVLSKFHSPDEATRLTRAAELLLLQGSHSLAIEKIEPALKIDALSMRARHVKALALIRLEKAQEATKILIEGAKINPAYYKNFATLADIYLAAGNKPEAVRAMTKELELNSKNPKRQVQLAKLLFDSRDLERAFAHYRAALRIDPKFSAALMGMGQVYAAAKNLDKAIYYFKRLRRYRPANSASLEAIAKVSLDFDEPKRAEYALRDERNQFPDREDTYLVLAKLYVALDNQDSAVATLEQLLSRKANSTGALKLLAEIGAHFKNPLLSIGAFERLILIPEGQTYENIQRLAETLLRAGQLEKAIERCHEAMALSREVQRPLIVLVECFLKLGDMTKAHFLFRRLEQSGYANPKMQHVAERCRTTILNRRQAPKRIA